MGPPQRSRVDHVVGRHLCLSDGVAPVFEREHLVLEQGMREAGDVAGDEDIVGDDAVHVEGAAAGVAGDPARTGRKSRLGQPFGVANRAQRDEGDVRLDPGAVRKFSAGQSAVAAGQRGDRHPAAQVHAVGALEFGGKRPEGAAEGADQRGWTALGDGHVNASLPAGGGDLGAGEASTDHQHAPRTGIEPFGQAGRVFTGAQREYAVERCLCCVRPGSRPGAGRDQQPVEG